MAFDIGVLDDNFKFIKTLHIDPVVAGVLFKKLVNPADYTLLGMAADDSNDIIYAPGDVPALLKDVEKLEGYLLGEKMMSEEVKSKCLKFASELKEICNIALEKGKSVDFIAGD